jgi:hypothetical protein
LEARAEGDRIGTAISRWINLRISAVEILSFGGLYLLLAIALGSWCFLGGAFSCVLTGISHWRMSSVSFRITKETAASPATR